MFFTNVPAHDIDVVAARPTDRSVTVSLLGKTPRRVHVAYGASPGGLTSRTGDFDLVPETPLAIDVAGLDPRREHFYAVRASDTGGAVLQAGRLQTQRAPGAEFSFTVTGCSHLDSGTRPEIYERTIRNIVADRPDFHIDLGDVFMTDKYSVFANSRAQYLAQRYWLGLVSSVAPVFLGIGNHDGEGGAVRDVRLKDIAAWSARMRTTHFPNPEPGPFYAASDEMRPGIGLLQNYYAFEWGSAQFIVLDPYWPTEVAGRDAAGWGTTLGSKQYQWLVRVLQGSKASTRFVFIHHLTGGGGQDHRGGVAAAPYFEWGGTELDGRNTFAQRRPGWAMPVHDLLVKNGVNVVFHAHDHLFAKETLDGIVYQEVPQPSHPENRVQNLADEYGYRTADILPSPGHMRVTVHGEGARVEYVRAFLPEEARQGRVNGRVDAAYDVGARA